MPEQPSSHALDLIAAAGERAVEARRLAAEALDRLDAGHPGPASTFLAMALLEFRAAVDRMKVTAAEVEAMWDEGFAAGRAIEQAAADDGNCRPRRRRRRAAMTRLGTGQPGC